MPDLSDLDVDLDQLTDPAARRLIVQLLNRIEEMHAETERLQAEVQRLTDENARLKGGAGRPTLRPQPPRQAARDVSSEGERHVPRPRRGRSKVAELAIHRIVDLAVAPAGLPPDAQFKGYEEVIVQDLLIQAQNTCFRKEKWYSPTTRRTYLAPLPAGYQGQFGPGLKALALALAYAGEMSEPKLLAVLRSVGIQVSAGFLAGVLIHDQDRFHAEAAAAVDAGLASSPWQHLDETGTRVNGRNHHCHILANPLFTSYTTTAGKDRQAVLDVLRHGAPRTYLLNAAAERVLRQATLAERTRRLVLTHLPRQTVLDEPTLDRWLAEHVPRLGPRQRQVIRDALGVAAYRARTDGPVVRSLLTDDAPQFAGVTAEHALCWIHAGRQLKQLTPGVPHHRRLLARFLARFWRYYRQLRAYREQPSPAAARRLERGFDRLFATETGYRGLDARIAAIRANRTGLLQVLAHPELPLHNNPAELGARQRVRKRDVSFGPRTAAGVCAWDTFQTLVATAAKLGVSFYAYVRDRVSEANALPPLADLIRERAAALHLGASWATPDPSPSF